MELPPARVDTLTSAVVTAIIPLHLCPTFVYRLYCIFHADESWYLLNDTNEWDIKNRQNLHTYNPRNKQN
jgi:hypothetical protein